MAKFILLLALAIIFIASINALSFGDCPRSNDVFECTPKCLHDSECSAKGGLCCPNQCNTRSCSRPKPGSQGSSSGAYKGSATQSATGQYCGNNKCGPNQKCEQDRSTKRLQCVRK